jgi:hypothetical protein
MLSLNDLAGRLIGADVTGRIEPIWYRDGPMPVGWQCCKASSAGGEPDVRRKFCSRMSARLMRCLSRRTGRRVNRLRRRKGPLGNFGPGDAGLRRAAAAIRQPPRRVVLRPDAAAVLEREVLLLGRRA